MLGSLSGTVIDIEGLTILIETSANVGYEVEVPGNTLNHFTLGKNVFLYIHHIIREDASLLYGFINKESRLLFREIIKVNGVGPKVALALLSVFDLSTFIKVINDNNLDLLTKAPGVGRKTAERIVVEMKDRIDKLRLNELVNNSDIDDITLINNLKDKKVDAFDVNGVAYEALKALVALGYKEQLAHKALKKIYSENMSTEDLIVQGLAYLTNSGK